MDIITMKLFEKYLPLDVIRYIDSFVYIKLNNDTIRTSVKLYFEDKELCNYLYGHMEYWKVSKVTDMSSLFYYVKCEIPDISKWNVSNVTNMHQLFSYAISFNSDLFEWNVRDMSHMFCCTCNFNSDISNWNINNVKDNYSMFIETSKLNSSYKPIFY